nr:leucine-rich repeat transmembrane protein kinase protein [Tanacetum cinerariifolium]
MVCDSDAEGFIASRTDNADEDFCFVFDDIEATIPLTEDVDIPRRTGDAHDDPYNLIYDSLPARHYVLKEQISCVHYRAKKFQYEFPTLCCKGGKTKLKDSNIPNELYFLFTSQCRLGKMFRDNIRAYNTSFSFASMGVKLDQLVPRDGVPRYLQLYCYDPNEDLSHRLRWQNLDREIVGILAGVLARNPYVRTFRSLADLGPLDNYSVRLTKSVELDQRLYNQPTTFEFIQPHYACYDPLAYALYFPNDEPKIKRRGMTVNDDENDLHNIEEEDEGRRSTVSMREYYCYKFQMRTTNNALLLGGRLLQQFAVDTYIKTETARLSYLELNQTKIRAYLHKGLVDCVHVGEMHPGRIDAMTLVQDEGKPDIFLTMTCNPNWPEIKIELLDGQTPADRPDLVARVFRAKLEDLKKMLFDKHILGEVVAHVFVVEFQKRGLPHAYFLLIMTSKDKITNPDLYERVTGDPSWADDELVVINDMKRFQDARYVSPPEAMWRIFGFHLSNIHPYVMALPIHLPNNQQVTFEEDDDLTEVIEKERTKRSMLTAFFECNGVDLNARSLLYKDFPRHYAWNKGSRHWSPRKKQAMRGHLVSASPAEGELYYLRILLSNVPGPTGWDDHYSVNNVRYSTIRKAALERGLIENDNCSSQSLTEAALFQLPIAQRRLFTTILIYCEPGDVRKLWDDHYESMSEDYGRQYDSSVQVCYMVLNDINISLQSMGKNLSDFDLPKISLEANTQFGFFRELKEEYAIVTGEEHMRVFYIDGPGGTGKTYLYNALLAEIRSRGFIAIATATSGAAANIMLAKLIIWDEASMVKRNAVEALDRSLQDIMGVRSPFGDLHINGTNSEYIISRTILTTKNENVDVINDELIERFQGEEKEYYSFDEAMDDKNNFYPLEFLNSLTVSGLTPHYLRLKIGSPIMLLRNLDLSNGLCNEDDLFPFKLKRKQFPIRLSFAMTLNKSQGQTIPNVGVYLPESVFSHGQLYVALSRGVAQATTKLLIMPAKKFNEDGAYTTNVLTTLRSFPENEQNCYTLKPPQGKNNRYLIRARFAYGNYDLKSLNPRFDLYLGADYWFTVVIVKPSESYTTEIIHFTSSDHINVCLRNTGHGIPFISVLELRLLDITMYNLPTLIIHYHRSSSSDKRIRYENDRYDRIWYPLSISDSRVVQSSNIISSGPLNDEKLSFEVMSNAVTPTNSTSTLTMSWAGDATDEFIIYIHLAEVEIIESNQKREFNIYLNGNDLFGSFSPSTNITTLTSQLSPGSSYNTLEIIKTTSSTLPPILNAIEIYSVKQFQQYQTQDQDAAAIWNTKSAYRIKRNWQGDPCVPLKFLWEGLNCDYNDLNATKIISLNLSSSGLSGEIVTALANLTMIESLNNDPFFDFARSSAGSGLVKLFPVKLFRDARNCGTAPVRNNDPFFDFARSSAGSGLVKLFPVKLFRDARKCGTAPVSEISQGSNYLSTQSARGQ